jgi:UPF0716 protein FxsA
MRFVPLFFLALVGGEIAVFIAVGQRVGVLMTLMLLFVSFVGGLALIRSTGLAFGQVMGRRPQTAEEAAKFATSASFRMLAGLLLMIPGFITDLLAGLLLLPAVQRLFRAKVSGGFAGARAEWTTGRARQGPVIEGEAVEIEGEIASGPDESRRP